MASSTTSGNAQQSTENKYLPKISSDNNANPNTMKSTGAIPKTKINTTTTNGVIPEVRLKLNNNLQENPLKPELNGTCSHETNSINLYNKTTSVTNGFKNATVNGVHNGSLNLCNQFSVYNQYSAIDKCFVNTLNRNSDSVESLANGIDPGPSTSRAENNIHTQQKTKDSESECSSDTGNDDLSCSDECCIYTYKGDVADLPSSFMNLDIPDNNETQDQSRAGSRGSSPEMDFLEMDFDPGPSCDADSDESSINSDLKSDANAPPCETLIVVEEIQIVEQPPEIRSDDVQIVDDNHEQNLVENNLSQSQQSSVVLTKTEPEKQNVLLPQEFKSIEMPLLPIHDEPWIPKSSSDRTVYSINLRESKGYHCSSGDLISPSEQPSTSSLECRINTSSALYHSTMEKQLVLDKHHGTTTTEQNNCIEKTMIWTEQEAALKQITQIGKSACGATAVLNTLLALGYPVPTNDNLMEAVNTRLRANSSPLVEYLQSRSVAGATHTDLICGLHQLSDGQIYARFFHMYPERYINLSQWLSYWIRKGAVPIATLNLQKGVKPEHSIPDAWHHQMIFGVGPHGVYLTNPLEKVEEGVFWHQLSSESVLLVKRDDVISRWTNRTNLRELIAIKDVRWHHLNVLGQVTNVIRENHRLVSPHAVSRTHISIPAAYSAGITLAININNPAYDILKHCPELPRVNMLP